MEFFSTPTRCYRNDKNQIKTVMNRKIFPSFCHKKEHKTQQQNYEVFLNGK